MTDLTAGVRSALSRSSTGPGKAERGSASIQMVVLLPALFAVMFLGMQAALWYHARTVATAGAQEGARTAGARDGTAGQGISRASQFVADAGGAGVLREVSITGNRSATAATVTVHGSCLSVIPGWTIQVDQSATVPVERLTS